MEFQGNVSIARVGKKTRLLAEDGMRIKNNDVVFTEDESNIWIRLSSTSMALLGAFSELEISNSKGSFSLDLKSGMVLARIDTPLKRFETFSIIVGNSMLSVRGTAFSAQIENENSALLNVYHGSVSVCDLMGSELITVNRGQFLRFNPKTGEVSGQVEAIDFNELPALFFEYVQDYSKKLDYAIDDFNDDSNDNSNDNFDGNSDDTLNSLLDSALLDTSTVNESNLDYPVTEIHGNSITPNASFNNIWTQDNSEFNWLQSNSFIVPPEVNFKYLWNGSEFKPFADVSWNIDNPAYILWQVYDENNNPLGASGRLESEYGGIFVTDKLFDISSPLDSNLYPENYTLRLTPFWLPEQSIEFLPMNAIIMELPYFDVSSEEKNGVLRPVISTNIGFYFNHSFENLKQTIENNSIRIKGKLFPVEGAMIPIEIDVLSK